MILADTSLWIGYFRLKGEEPEMRKHLAAKQILMHPFVVAELSLGSLAKREETLFSLDELPQARVAHLSEVRRMIESRNLYNAGIGLTDAHLIASTLLTPKTRLWTRDKRLRIVAEALGIALSWTRG